MMAAPIVLIPLAAAWIQWGVAGLPAIPASALADVSAGGPVGFPAWIRLTHFVNFLFLVLLIRSGLQILMDHPRLYWNIDCTPNTEWARFTPIEVPTDRVWNAKDDARALSPWVGLPGRRHTVGMARHWHFLSVIFWVGNGVVFVALVISTGHWARVVPTSWRVLPDAWAVFVHYATLHLPPEPDGFFRYNALQQLAYFGVIFVLAPLAILTGPSMSPALTNRFRWFPRLPGNRQVGRSLHFLTMCAFVVFLVAHVVMVAVTGLSRNMNHIVLGSDHARPLGLYVGLGGILVVIALNALANWAAWRRPRTVQHVAKAIVTPVMRLLNTAAPVAQFPADAISPFFWPNGKVPTADAWKSLVASGLADYRLRVYGLVEHPVELSLEEIRAMRRSSQITLHHCIQGWSGIAQWGGLPMAALMDLVRPTAAARVAIFHSYGEGLEGGYYYDSHPVETLRHPQSLLAYEMNFEPLNEQHGTPLRLRVENQLGFKMVKWIRAIEFAASVESVGMGEGGYNEDHEYFGELANI
jgi:methionine sulfoxide reductase catalytic subunit